MSLNGRRVKLKSGDSLRIISEQGSVSEGALPFFRKNMDRGSYNTLKHNRKMRILFLILFGLSSALLIYIFKNFLWLFAFSFILSMAVKPVYARILRYVRSRSLSAFLVVLLLIVVLIVPALLLLASLADQSYRFYVYLQKQIESGILDQFQQNPVVRDMLDYLNISGAELLEKGAAFAQNSLLKAMGAIAPLVTFPVFLIINVFFSMLVVFFLLKDGEKLPNVIYRLLPFPDKLEKEVAERLKTVIKILLAGNIFITLLQGLMVGLGFFIAGFRAPLLWGSIAGILSLIPVIGTTFIWVPAAVYLFCTGSYGMGLFLSVWCFVWYLVLENLVKPIVFGGKLKFHPLLFFFLLIGSLQAFNIAGILIGPIALTFFFSMWEIYRILDFQGGGDNDLPEEPADG